LQEKILKKIFVGGLPQDATEASVTKLFSEYGKVRSIKLVTDVFSGRCRGFGFIEMEGHEARTAIEALDGRMVNNYTLKVRFEDTSKKKARGRRR
jgi:RNA recognition motif-containing protein